MAPAGWPKGYSGFLDCSSPKCKNLFIIKSWNKLSPESKPVSETFGLSKIWSLEYPPPFSPRVTAEIQSRGKAGSQDSRRKLASCREVAVFDIPLSLTPLTLVFLRQTPPDHNLNCIINCIKMQLPQIMNPQAVLFIPRIIKKQVPFV